MPFFNNTPFFYHEKLKRGVYCPWKEKQKLIDVIGHVNSSAIVDEENEVLIFQPETLLLTSITFSLTWAELFFSWINLPKTSWNLVWFPGKGQWERPSKSFVAANTPPSSARAANGQLLHEWIVEHGEPIYPLADLSVFFADQPIAI